VSGVSGSQARVADSVQSLVRGLTVITVFDADNAHLTLSEVARRADLSRATARRVLHTLVALGYVATDGKEFSLRPRILELGHAYLSGLGLPEVAVPHLERLRQEVHESCSVAVLDDTDVVYVAREATSRIMTVAIHVGTRFPAHLTSMGRVLLAHLPDAELDELLSRVELEPVTPHTITDEGKLRAELRKIAGQGFAMVDQELELGLRSIAAPIRDASGTVCAALNVSASARRGTKASIRAELLPPLLSTAQALEHDLALVQRH
jgi:IclR family transcriptional regulator, pca regulon regulatory protein